MRLTLLSDGPTDRALVPVLEWLGRESSTEPFETSWADLRWLPRPPTRLEDRVRAAIDLYPCDILVVHRDAEREDPEKRRQEIDSATRDLHVPVVSAVPVRMTEAWLLFDVPAIRQAAGCPGGAMELDLPAPRDVESVADPKDVLRATLRAASNLSGRRLKAFRPDVYRLSALIEDFAPLRAVPSFRAFEESLCSALLSLGRLKGRSPAKGTRGRPARRG